MDGNGIFYYPNGDKYEVAIKDNKINGKATYYWANGDK